MVLVQTYKFINTCNFLQSAESHFARKRVPYQSETRWVSHPLKKPPPIIDMNGIDTFLDINNAHLRVNSGNVQASTFVLDQINIVTSANTATTVNFNNVTKAFNAVSNIEVGTANLFVDTTTSKVGIGTDAPAYTLDVHGSANVGALTATTFSGSGAGLTALDAANIATGTLDAGRVPDLDAAKITTGTLDAARVPDLDAAKITTGTLDVARVPNLNTSILTAGTLPVSRGGTGTTSSTGTGAFVLQNAPAFTGDATFDTNTLKIDAINNRVGIGTTTPATNLHLVSNTQTGSGTENILTIDAISSDYSSVTNEYGGAILFRTNRGTDDSSKLSARIKGKIRSGAGGTADYHGLDIDVYGDNSSLNKIMSCQSTNNSGNPGNLLIHGDATFNGGVTMHRFMGSGSGTFSGTGTFNLPCNLDYGAGQPEVGWEIRLSFGFSGTNYGYASIGGAQDEAGGNVPVYEGLSIQIRQNQTNWNNQSSSTYLTHRETVAPAYTAIIRIVQGRGSSIPGINNYTPRWHFSYECTGCHATVGATTYRGQGYFKFASSTGRIKYLRLNSASGSMSGHYNFVAIS